MFVRRKDCRGIWKFQAHFSTRSYEEHFKRNAQSAKWKWQIAIYFRKYAHYFARTTSSCAGLARE